MIGNVTDFVAYAESRGVSIDSAGAPVLLIKAADYMNTMCWIGVKAQKTQEDAWPRNDINGNPIIDDDQAEGDTPMNIQRAAYRFAMAVNDGVDLLATISGSQVTEERVEGAVTVKYQESSIGAAPYFPWADSMIGSYLDCGASCPLNFPVGRA